MAVAGGLEARPPSVRVRVVVVMLMIVIMRMIVRVTRHPRLDLLHDLARELAERR